MAIPTLPQGLWPNFPFCMGLQHNFPFCMGPFVSGSQIWSVKTLVSGTRNLQIPPRQHRLQFCLLFLVLYFFFNPFSYSFPLFFLPVQQLKTYFFYILLFKNMFYYFSIMSSVLHQEGFSKHPVHHIVRNRSPTTFLRQYVTRAAVP